jgi:hypothetical protein
MAFEFYPEALEGTIRRAWMNTDGLPVPVLVPENGVGTDDDEARFEYVSRALAEWVAASMTASTCRDIRSGACSITSNGPSVTDPHSGSSKWTARHSNAALNPAQRGWAVSPPRIAFERSFSICGRVRRQILRIGYD